MNISIKRRVLSVVIAVLLVTGLVTGVAVATANYESPAPSSGLYIDGKYVENPGYILKLGDQEVSFTDYRHYYLMNKFYSEAMNGDTYWKEDYDGAREMELRKATDEALQQQYAWIKIAEENNIALTEEEKADIRKTLEEQKKTLGPEFNTRLYDMFFTDEEMYLRITEMQTLAQKAKTQFEDLAWEKNENTLLEKSVVTAKHILFAFPTQEDIDAGNVSIPEGQTVEDVSLEFAKEVEAYIRTAGATGVPVAVPAAKDTAESEAATASSASTSAVPALTGTTDEVEVVSESSSAEPVMVSPLEAAVDEMRERYDADKQGQPAGGYTFGPGQMVDEFYEAALALPVGEMSEPVKTTYGYHLILRMPLDTTYAQEHKEELVGRQITEIVNTTLDTALEALPITKGEHYGDITPSSLT